MHAVLSIYHSAVAACVLCYRAVDSLRQTLEVNVVGVHAMIQAFLPLLQAGHKKTVINISSGSGSLTRRYEEVIIMPLLWYMFAALPP